MMKLLFYRHILAGTMLALVMLWPAVCTAAMPAATGMTTGRQYYFISYDGRNGLSHNTVNKIIQDRLGFLWVGTKDGLNRFDGTSFRIFNKENSQLGNNCIIDLAEDGTGHLWIATDAGLYIFDPVTEHFYTARQYCHLTKEITHTVTHVKTDADGNVWFSADEEGLYFYNIRKKRLTVKFENLRHKPAMANVADFCLYHSGVWMSLYNDNLYYTANGFRKFIPYRDKNGAMPFHKVVVNYMTTIDNTLYICTSNGLYRLSAGDGTCTRLLDGYVRTIEKSDGRLWAGTENGLYIIDQQTGAMQHITSSALNDQYSLTDNAIYSIFRDRSGGVWIGTYFGGLNYYPAQWHYFEKYYPREGMEFMGRRVREFCKGSDGTIWIGTEDRGLFNFNPQTRTLAPAGIRLSETNIHGLCFDGRYLWIGTFAGGLNRLDLNTRQVKVYRQSDAPNALSSDAVFSFCRDRDGKLWIGTISGLLTYNRRTDDFTRIPQMAERFVYYILQDRSGTIWFATYANGIYSYNPRTRRWRNYVNRPGDASSLSYNKVISIFQDSRGRLWFMTQGGGLCLYNPKRDSFRRYDMSSGFPSNIVYRMVEDNMGKLWVSTSRGLVCFDPSTGHTDIYREADGLLTSRFNYQSGYKDTDGTIYMGTINGFIAFNPATFRNDPVNPPIYFTELYIFNKRMDVGTDGSPLKKSLLYSDRITLSAEENSIVIETASLSFLPSEKRRLEYMVEGLDNTWHAVNNDGEIYLSNLPYRTYKLHVRGLNSQGNPNGQQRTLEIRVRPPFYLSVWAYLFYLLLAAAVACYILYRLKIRIARKQRKAMYVFEQEKERELYEAKINFFTNITHEIRTPLTLIKGPLDNIISHAGRIPEEIKDDLKVMDTNTGRLLSLVNQLLDFRKSEGNGIRLNFVKTDVSRLLTRLCATFTPALKSRMIHCDTVIAPEMEAAVDTEAFNKIVSNLLSNAMKHAAAHIRLSAAIADGRLRIAVENDGEVIPLSMREQIFKPFVQFKGTGENAAYGTGLGLTLARSLAEYHHGTLAMDNVMSVNRFILSLPVVQEMEIDVNDKDGKTAVTTNEEKTAPEKAAAGRHMEYTLLIVEDNADMLKFIVKTLHDNYNVLTAADGLQAIEVLKKHVVNLIVSDIMMPHMDGIALCNWVKNNIDYSHIPVILLSAKTTVESKIEGSKSGADAYLEKPFSIDYLRAEVENLLKSREQLRRLFVKSPYIQTNAVTLSNTDSEFLKKVHETVVANMSDADFSLDQLAEKLNMSRSSLNRKFRGLLDVTPNDYIRIERLKQAAMMLRNGEARITEVCYRCGFNTPSYFAKCFQKQFGVLPKDFMAENNK